MDPLYLVCPEGEVEASQDVREDEAQPNEAWSRLAVQFEEEDLEKHGSHYAVRGHAQDSGQEQQCEFSKVKLKVETHHDSLLNY